MVLETRQLERSLGAREKVVAPNEFDTAVVQRRCLRAGRDLPEGHVVARGDIDVLRPASPGAFRPHELSAVLGRAITVPVLRGEALERFHLED